MKMRERMCGRRKEDKINEEDSILRENLKEGSMTENRITQEMSPWVEGVQQVIFSWDSQGCPGLHSLGKCNTLL